MAGFLKHLPIYYYYYITLITTLLHKTISYFLNLPNHTLFFSVVTLNEYLLHLYFHYHNLKPQTITLDSHTHLHFWVPTTINKSKPSIVLIHGFGGNAKWQLHHQISSLSQSSNLYVPDLLFFGKSYSSRSGRSDAFQAECVGEGLRRLGVERYGVFGVSYGGYVAYQMADMYRDEVEKVVVLSSGICYSEEERVRKIIGGGKDVEDIFIPENVEDLRMLIGLSWFKPFWVPDFVLQDFINVMNRTHKKERKEMLHHLLMSKSDLDSLPVLNQETLIIWGDADKVFPLNLGHRLARHLGAKAKLEVIKDVGHAANLESPHAVNHLLKSFFTSSSNYNVQR
ncbi:hypothetical protein GIB67_017308 [Kingdonia uniflora]|uniref:AB hydrolase-1 domain-containing protein n=1 Tax=Kingdonia uniflora TaxID=39325 RepID=A0A7J7N5X6_9MAGN|nr:hypothetical protein GIB67_017308 [Kingdonia uniflora]